VKKLLAIPIIALALATTAGLAPAALDDVKGPTCADIIDSSWLYSADGSTATVDLTIDGASCPAVTYSLVAVDSAANQTLVGSGMAQGDGSTLPGQTFDIVTVTATGLSAGSDGVICLYATTSIGKHVFDRAPDADLTPNCLELITGGTGGGTGYN
jgi:hypothetical protein